MEFIKSILPLIQNHIFAESLGDSSQLKRLHELIWQGKIQTDEDGVQVLYGPGGSQLAFKKQKQRLRDRLTEYVLQNGVTFKNLDEYARLYRKSMNKVMAVKTLMLSNARVPAVNIGENLIKTTILCEYTDLTLLLARELYSYYSAINYNAVKRKKYEKIMDGMQQLYNRELEANKYYSDLRVSIAISRGSKKDKVVAKALFYSDKLKPYLTGESVSYELLLKIYLVVAMRYELTKDYAGLLETCEKAIELFRKRRVNRKFAYYLFDARRIICFIHFKMNDKAEKLASGYLSEMTPGHINWFDLNIQLIVSRLHARNYQGAYELLEQVRNNKGYSKLPGAIYQTWMVYEAHLEFLLAIKKVVSTTPSKFRLFKFLNEIPIYTKDKRGLNIAILIVHVLFLLYQRKYTQIIDRVDALNQYCHRHLRRDDTFRSNCFIKMLLQVPKADFNKKRAERYAMPYLTKLESMPLSISEQSIEVEIIQYEDLWLMVLELLDG